MNTQQFEVNTQQFVFLRCHLSALRAADYAHSPNIAVRILTALMDYPSTSLTCPLPEPGQHTDACI